MQLIQFSGPISLALCILLWLSIHILSVWIAQSMKKSRFSSNSFLYRTRLWEKNGIVYRNWFHVDKWKKKLPDGGALIKNGFAKKHLDSFTADYLETFLVESCRAEFSHWIAILPFWVFGFFMPSYAIVIMFLYALALNLPCIIAQRYNRPRIEKLMSQINSRK